MSSPTCLRVDFLVHGDEREAKNIWFVIYNDNTVFTLYGRAFSLRNVHNIDNISNILKPDIIPSSEIVYSIFSNTELNELTDGPEDIFEIEWRSLESNPDFFKNPIINYGTPEAIEAWNKYNM
jgi:hypothetical protein